MNKKTPDCAPKSATSKKASTKKRASSALKNQESPANAEAQIAKTQAEAKVNAKDTTKVKKSPAKRAPKKKDSADTISQVSTAAASDVTVVNATADAGAVAGASFAEVAISVNEDPSLAGAVSVVELSENEKASGKAKVSPAAGAIVEVDESADDAAKVKEDDEPAMVVHGKNKVKLITASDADPSANASAKDASAGANAKDASKGSAKAGAGAKAGAAAKGGAQSGAGAAANAAGEDAKSGDGVDHVVKTQMEDSSVYVEPVMLNENEAAIAEQINEKVVGDKASKLIIDKEMAVQENEAIDSGVDGVQIKLRPKKAAPVPLAVIDLAKELTYIPIVLSLNRNDGSKAPINAAELGTLVHLNYSLPFNTWAKIFINFFDHNAMVPLLNQLKAGLDPISCTYIDRHYEITQASRFGTNAFVNKFFLWTDEDRRLFENFKTMRENGPEFLRAVNVDWASNFTNLYGLYHVPAPILKGINGKAVIDGGAFVGDTLNVWRGYFANSPVYAYEPGTKNFETMMGYFHSYVESGAVKMLKVGLGKEVGKLQFNSPTDNISAAASTAQGAEEAQFTEEVEITTIDEEVRKYNLEVGLIKLDIEGGEMDALAGAVDTIKTQRPVLVIAIYHNPQQFYGTKAYLESLNLDYTFQVRRSCFSNAFSDLVLVAYPTPKPEDQPTDIEAAASAAPNSGAVESTPEANVSDTRASSHHDSNA